MLSVLISTPALWDKQGHFLLPEQECLRMLRGKAFFTGTPENLGPPDTTSCDCVWRPWWQVARRCQTYTHGEVSAIPWETECFSDLRNQKAGGQARAIWTTFRRKWNTLAPHNNRAIQTQQRRFCILAFWQITHMLKCDRPKGKTEYIFFTCGL